MKKIKPYILLVTSLLFCGCALVNSGVNSISPFLKTLSEAKSAMERNDLMSFKVHVNRLISIDNTQAWPLKLIDAANRDRLDYLKAIAGAGFKSKASSGNYSLYEFGFLERAIKEDNAEGIRVLLRAGFSGLAISTRELGLEDIGNFCPPNKSIVECALIAGSEDSFEVFIDEGLIPAITLDGRPLLITAVQANKIQAVKFLLKRGATADISYDGKSAFDYALNSDIKNLIVDYGGFPQINNPQSLLHQFRQALSVDPKVAFNIAIGVRKANAPVGAELLGDYFSKLSETGDTDQRVSNQALALFSYRESAQAGGYDGLAKMAQFFDNGIVVEKNPEIAEKLQTLALSRGSEIARVALIEKGRSVTPSATVFQSSAQTSEAPVSNAVNTAMGILDIAAAVFLGVQTGKSAAASKTHLSQNYISAMNRAPPPVPQPRPDSLLFFTCRPSVSGTQLNCSKY